MRYSDFTKMSLAVIRRFTISSCRSKIHTNAYCNAMNLNSMIRSAIFTNEKCPAIDVCKIHIRFLHDSPLLRNNKLTQPEIAVTGKDISTLQLKKRPPRRNRAVMNEDMSNIQIPKSNAWSVKALTTAEEYNLEALICGLQEQQLYIPKKISTTTNPLPDVVYAVAKYDVGHEPREIFFFREGSIVMWNISNLECGNLLRFLHNYEHNRYTDEMIHNESELMTYTYVECGKRSHLKDGDIVLVREAGNLDKYTFSNAMAQSVKLGIWEASLNNYADSIEFVTEDLKEGRKLRMTEQEVLKKQGELFALRHRINLSSDLLDTPDFYWEQDDLERLYQQICGYLSIGKRTKVMNERLNHCMDLISLVSSHLSDRHHIRLEWMIIVLIMVEVAFEVLHYVDRYFV